MVQWARRFHGRRAGATAVEYSVMVVLIAAVIVAIVLVVGRQTCEAFADTSEALSRASVTAQPPPGVDPTCP